jgi:tripartite-type tricarboxylate transporter receptor subunit TctC
MRENMSVDGKVRGSGAEVPKNVALNDGEGRVMRQICRVLEALRVFVVVLAVAAMFWGGVAPAGAADLAFPKKAIDVVVPQAPGGSTDAWARIITPYLSKKLGVPVNVLNKTGGATVIGTMVALTSPADGYTIFFDGYSIPSVTATMVNCPFKWNDPTPIAKVADGALAFSVQGDSPWRTMKDAIDHMRKDPASINVGIGGFPAVFALATLFNSVGIDFTRMARINFDGGGPTMAALAGKHVMLTSQPLGNCIAMHQAGKIRILAITSTQRSTIVPDVPTGKELGFTAYNRGTYGGVAGPPNLPPAIVKIFADAIKEALQDPAAIAKFEARETEVDFLGPKEYGEFLGTMYKDNLASAERLGLRK